MENNKKALVIADYIARVEATREFDWHPAVRALRTWWHDGWHEGKDITELDEDQLFREATGPQRLPDIVPQLLKLPSNREYAVRDGECREYENGVRISDRPQESVTAVGRWHGDEVIIWSPVRSDKSRDITPLPYPDPDTRPVDPLDRFEDRVGEPVTVEGSSAMFFENMGTVLGAVREAVDPDAAMAQQAERLNKQALLPSPDEMVDMILADKSGYSKFRIARDPGTGELALFCEMGGVYNFTGGWYLMVYPK